MSPYYLINLLIYAAVDESPAWACPSSSASPASPTSASSSSRRPAGTWPRSWRCLRRSANGGFQSYIGGLNLPFPLPWIGAAVAGGVIALPFVFLVGRRLRGDFAAVGLLVTAVLLNLLATNYRPLLNGDAGLSLIPAPFQGEFNPQSSGYQWFFTAGAIVVCALVFLVVRRITASPYGRSLRAMRDNDVVADSLGKNLLSMRTAMLVTGGAIAGLSGGILVSYITTWSPAAWGYAETVVLFAAVIIGGAGNHARRRARRHPRARWVRGGHPVHPHVQQPAAEPDPVAGVGGDRALDRDLPVGAAARDFARTEAGTPGNRRPDGGGGRPRGRRIRGASGSGSGGGGLVALRSGSSDAAPVGAARGRGSVARRGSR